MTTRIYHCETHDEWFKNGHLRDKHGRRHHDEPWECVVRDVDGEDMTQIAAFLAELDVATPSPEDTEDIVTLAREAGVDAQLTAWIGARTDDDDPRLSAVRACLTLGEVPYWETDAPDLNPWLVCPDCGNPDAFGFAYNYHEGVLACTDCGTLGVYEA